MKSPDELIIRLTLWHLLQTDEERAVLLKGTKLLNIEAGQHVFNEGAPITQLFYLSSGQAIMTRAGVSGRSHITRLVRSGQFFGMRPYFAGKPAQTTATALETSQVLAVSVSTIRLLLANNTRICHYFLEALATELEQAEERMITLTQKHIRGRLAETLLLLARHYGYGPDGATLNIYLSRSDLATLSNMTTSNAIRTLSQFATERLVALDGRRIRIIDPTALETVSRYG